MFCRPPTPRARPSSRHPGRRLGFPASAEGSRAARSPPLLRGQEAHGQSQGCLRRAAWCPAGWDVPASGIGFLLSRFPGPRLQPGPGRCCTQPGGASGRGPWPFGSCGEEALHHGNVRMLAGEWRSGAGSGAVRAWMGDRL
ncbi:uncharacterized protein LOC143688444 [Tamandua tetradactyla]|uniref:uncharacterized protein LOC143688444 n=1 Tax=Tamandua tetradactyla TaxID=48850 RepID=UPI004053F7D0